MVNFAQLRDLDTSKLTTAASTSAQLSGDLSSRGTEVASAAQPVDAWHGADAAAKTSMMSPLANPLYDASDAFNYGSGVLDTLVDDLTAAKSKLESAIELAAGTGIQISADGTVTTPEVTSMAVAERNAELAAQIRREIDEALEDANDADISASGSLARTELGWGAEAWVDGRVEAEDGRVLVEGSPGAGWRRDYDFDAGDQEGWEAGWKLGPQGNAGVELDESHGARAWADARLGLTGYLDSPEMDLSDYGIHGVSGSGGANIGVGPSTGVELNPRPLDIDIDGREVNVQADFSHTFERVPITIGANADITVDLDEVSKNWLISGPWIDSVLPWN